MRSLHSALLLGLFASFLLPALHAQANPPVSDPKPRDYTRTELVVLDSLEGFGDPGLLDTSSQIVAPGSSLGFSIRVQFNHTSGAPVDWWNIHADLPQSVSGYDAVSFDIYKESADPSAALTLTLAEDDDNRWKIWDHPLSDLPAGKWTHITVARAQMTLWLLSQRKPDWNSIGRFTVEPRAGKSVFYLDNLCLSGPAQKPLFLLNMQDDGLRANPAWQTPLQPAVPLGAILFPSDLIPALNDLGHATPQGMRQSTGGPVAMPISHFGEHLRETAQECSALGILTPYYAQIGYGYPKFLTTRQAWDKNASGLTLNTKPIQQVNWDYQHSIALSHPAVREAGRQRTAALLKAGITTWVVPDYVFPYYEAQFGFSDAMEEAFRRDLLGTGEMLHLRTSRPSTGTRPQAGGQTLSFPDYFRAYNGFFPVPSDLGLTSWQDFVPPRPDDLSPVAVRRRVLFLHLRAYEWLKLPDALGREYAAQGGQPLWLILNGESTYVTPDYVYLLRSQGVGSLMPEAFGNAGLLAEAGYSSLPYLREEADHSHVRLSVNTETGAGGHSAPYWDWRVAYNGVYALASETRADNLDNDFMDEAPYKVMSNPASGYQFTRFRDAVTKARAFRQARADRAATPVPPILSVTDRPTGRETADIFDGMGAEYSLSLALSRAHLPFQTRDTLELARVMTRYRMIFYAPKVPRVGDFSLLHAWLLAGAGHVLVTHTFVPTRDARGFRHLDHGVQTGEADGGAALGLGRITTTDVLHCKVTATAGEWGKLFPAGIQIDLNTPLTRCEKGETLVDTDAGPLISRVRVGAGQVIYLHFSSVDPNVAGVLMLNRLAAQALAAQEGIAPLCTASADTSLQVFAVPGGQSIVAWDAPALNKWNFEYRPGLSALPYAAADVSDTIRIPVASGKAQWVYDFWTDHAETIIPTDGGVTFSLQNTVTGLYYVGDDTPLFRATVAEAQKTRATLRAAQFESVP